MGVVVEIDQDSSDDSPNTRTCNISYMNWFNLRKDICLFHGGLLYVNDKCIVFDDIEPGSTSLKVIVAWLQKQDYEGKLSHAEVAVLLPTVRRFIHVCNMAAECEGDAAPPASRRFEFMHSYAQQLLTVMERADQLKAGIRWA